ncbi:hypothetical protein DSO57_1008252 [Entomophthora muscae]|uniref:Uncharacterized protein n=1 Tax=Entomophthora muscae TaxID=34485 RepID=A0ACC2TIF7_9FUNG|nr:hypothetical protein DSO57_1008252 [Entomophthora muscae]
MLDISYKKGGLAVLTMINTVIGLAFIWLAIFDASSGSISRYSFYLPMVVSLAGLYIIIISLHGLVATVVESPKQLYVNSSMIAVSILANGVILALLAYGRFTVDHYVNTFWLDAYKHRVYLIRNIEEEFKCCGLRDINDHAFPDNGSVTCSTSDYFGYTTPCFWQLKESVESEMDIALGWVAAALLLQLLTIALSLSTYRVLQADAERAPLLSSQND